MVETPRPTLVDEGGVVSMDVDQTTKMDMEVTSIILHISKMSLTYPYNMLRSIKANS